MTLLFVSDYNVRVPTCEKKMFESSSIGPDPNPFYNIIINIIVQKRI